MAMSTCCPLSCSCRKSLIVVISWVSQEYPDLKPWFKFVRILFFSRCFRRCLQIMCTSIFFVGGGYKLSLFLFTYQTYLVICYILTLRLLVM